MLSLQFGASMMPHRIRINMLPTDTKLAIVSLTVLEAIALMNGINGTIFTIVVIAISGLGGYSVGRYLDLLPGRGDNTPK